MTQYGYADKGFRIEAIWTTDAAGTPRSEFLPGEALRCFVSFQILEPVEGTVSVRLRIFGDGWNETFTQTARGGVGSRMVVFGGDSPMHVSFNAGKGKVTLRVTMDAQEGQSSTHGRSHVYIRATCEPGNFPKQYLGSIEVAPQPYDMALTLDDRYLYVTTNVDRRIEVIDTALFEVVKVIQDPEQIGEPRGITLNGDGSEMLVSDYATGRIHVISTATHQWLEGVTVTNRKGLSGIAFNRIKNELYVLDFSNSSLIICNGFTYEFEDEIFLVGNGLGSVGLHPLDVRIDPSGSWAYILCQFYGTVAKVDLYQSKVVAWNMDPGPESMGMDLSPDGKSVYVVHPNLDMSPSSYVYAFNTTDLSPIRSFPVRNFIWDLVVSPDGRYAYAADSSSGEVVVIDLVNGEVLTHCAVPIGYGGKILQPSHLWTKLFVGRWAPGYVDVVGW